MSTPAMMPTLEHAQAALAGIPGLVSCEIGRKEDVSPNDYPMIQIVPTRITPGAAYAGRTVEVWIYFGVPIEKVDELDNVYEGLSELEVQILDILGTIQGQYRETITDQDFFETYKLAAIRAELTAPDTPHVKCAIYGATVTETLGASPVVVAPFTAELHTSDAADWTPTLASGSIERLLNGAASTRTRVTLTGSVAGAAASEVTIGIYAGGALVGNRVLVATTGVSAPIAFEVGATYVAGAAATYDVRATGTAGDYVFSGLTLTAQRV